LKLGRTTDDECCAPSLNECSISEEGAAKAVPFFLVFCAEKSESKLWGQDDPVEPGNLAAQVADFTWWFLWWFF
jgi:hypothetical protein